MPRIRICPKNYKANLVLEVSGPEWRYAQMQSLSHAGWLANRVQLTSDGHRPYILAVENAFGSEVDDSMLVKHYTGILLVKEVQPW